jgi:hypothetical protein
MIMTGLAKVAIPALGVLLVVAGVAAAVAWGGTLFANSNEGEEAAVPAATPRAAMPPIDAAAPTEIETATFALG